MAVEIDQGPLDGPDRIGPEYTPKQTPRERVQRVVRAFTTKDGLIGSYDYGQYINNNCLYQDLIRFKLFSSDPIYLLCGR
jgi:hypothetical protein